MAKLFPGKKYIETKLLRKLNGSHQQREEAFVEIYKRFFPKAERYILNNQGNLDDARDVFQEALKKLYENYILNRNIEKLQNLESFILWTCKTSWIDIQRRKKLEMDRQSEIELDLKPDSNDLKETIRGYFQSLGEKCQQMLEYRYFEEYSLEDIADRLGYKGEGSARESVKRCVKKLRALIKNHSFNLV